MIFTDGSSKPDQSGPTVGALSEPDAAAAIAAALPSAGHTKILEPAIFGIQAG